LSTLKTQIYGRGFHNIKNCPVNNNFLITRAFILSQYYAVGYSMNKTYKSYGLIGLIFQKQVVIDGLLNNVI